MHDSCHHEEGELLKLSRGPSLSPPSDVGGMGQGGADVEYGTTVVNSTKASPARTVNWIHAVFLLLAQIVGTGVLELSGNVASIGWIGLAPLLLFAPVNIYTGVLLTRLLGISLTKMSNHLDKHGPLKMSVALKKGTRTNEQTNERKNERAHLFCDANCIFLTTLRCVCH